MLAINPYSLTLIPQLMSKPKIQKTKDLEELTAKLAQAKGAVFSDYRGTTVKDLDKFRKELRKENVFSKVYKITLLKKAMEQNGMDASSVNYKTPVIMAMSNEDEVAAARIIRNLSKELKTINILEGIVDKKVIGKAQVLALAELPGKQQLLSQLVGAINAPVSGFVNVLAGNIRGLINVFNAIAAK